MKISGLRRVLAVGLGVLFLFATAIAIVQTREALTYREMSAASTQLELASHTLTMIELIEAPPAGVEIERVDAIALLENGEVIERTGLSFADRLRATELIEELTKNAQVDGETERARVEELLGILHADAANSEERGAEASSTAFAFIVLSAISGFAVVFEVLSGQRRERKLKSSLRDQAFTDFLTGLPNRRELSVQFELAKQTMEHSPVHTAMLYMDLDGFKEINDASGHATGDEILRTVAGKLRAVRGSNETLVRLGGDEFGVVVSNLQSAEEALEVAERYRTCLQRGANPADALHMSIGVATASNVTGLDDLANRANLAMYDAKKRQGSSVVLYHEAMTESANSTSTLLRCLRSADLDEEFSLEYQPVVEIETGEVFFAEALVRWNCPVVGRVGPDQFIPLAERSGEIIRIGRWVLQRAMAQLLAWQDNPLTRDLSISVNASIHEVEADDYIEPLRAAVAAGDIDPSRLIIEVTESSATGPMVMERLAEIQELGFRVAIDDFGSGYSNLAQLIHIPYDILKVDRMLISSLEKCSDGQQQSIEVLAAVSAIARANGNDGAPVVCEGVEEAHQLQSLREAGISHIQGWLISKSVSPEAFVDFLEERTSYSAAA